jgi:transcriptional regulator with XRE-family HTH domain
VDGDIRVGFGQRVRVLRDRRGWSQEQLAQACGLHRTYVGGIERGERNPSLINIGRIANALGVGVAELFLTPGDPGAELAP